jgi:hypothetical protein
VRSPIAGPRDFEHIHLSSENLDPRYSMNLLDRTFVVMFARQRRKNASLESSWRTARNQMLGYLIFPVVSAGGIGIALMHPLLMQYPAAERRQIVQLAGVLIWLAAGLGANWRFTRYLRSHPDSAAIGTWRPSPSIWICPNAVRTGRPGLTAT